MWQISTPGLDKLSSVITQVLTGLSLTILTVVGFLEPASLHLRNLTGKVVGIGHRTVLLLLAVVDLAALLIAKDLRGLV